MTTLLERIIEAHGGLARWQDVGDVLARVSMGGLEFTSRMQGSPLTDTEVTVSASMPSVSLAQWPVPGQTGRFTSSRVWIESDRDGLIAQRCAPGTVFRSVRHWLWWDQMDVLYYCGLALWQALCLPFSLLRSGCQCEELEAVDQNGGRWGRLRVTFPADVPGLSPDQILYADAAGLVRRIDYAPSLYGAVWRVTQLLDHHESFDGFVHATQRRIYPCLPTGQPLSFTRLGWLDIEDVTYTRRDARVGDGDTSPHP